MIGAEIAHHVELGSRCGCSDMAAKGFCDLNCRAADAARGADHQDLVAGLDAGLVAQEIERGRAAEGDRRGLIEIEIGGHGGNRPGLGDHRVFGIATEAGAGIGEDPVAGGEAGDLASDGLDHAGELGPENLAAGPEKPEHQAADQTETRRHVETAGAVVARGYGGGADPDQHFTGFRIGPGKGDGAEDLGGSVAGIGNGLHVFDLLLLRMI
jgi:hypothetical protein